MNTDCAFYIGTTHEVCQDYALAGKNSLVISDGCSSSPLSDIGSRVLSITAINKVKELDTLFSFDEKECILLARPTIKMLNIPDECLDATLLIATLYKHALEATSYGDGVIAIKTKDGDITIIDCAYEDSYPFYINYMYNNTGRYGNWLKNHDKKRVTLSTLKPNGDIEPFEDFIQQTRIKDLGILYSRENKLWIELVATDLIEYVAIMSDGVHSFYETIETETSRYNKSISYLEVLKELLSFKNYNKSFVQRRINKFRKACVKKNWANSDDFSLAVISPGK
jgi:hypothetical protein